METSMNTIIKTTLKEIETGRPYRWFPSWTSKENEIFKGKICTVVARTSQFGRFIAEFEVPRYGIVKVDRAELLEYDANAEMIAELQARFGKLEERLNFLLTAGNIKDDDVKPENMETLAKSLEDKD